jgi:hypothetical protein
MQRLVRSDAVAYHRGSAGPLSGTGHRLTGAMAQLVAHLLCKQGVRGSSPLGSTAKVLVIGMFAPRSIDVDRAEFHKNFT